jgi:hypothetical protein
MDKISDKKFYAFIIFAFLYFAVRIFVSIVFNI